MAKGVGGFKVVILVRYMVQMGGGWQSYVYKCTERCEGPEKDCRLHHILQKIKIKQQFLNPKE